jgi:hypothetical protein
MDDFGESFCWTSTHALSWTVGGYEFGMSFFKGLKFRQELIVLEVRNLR